MGTTFTNLQIKTSDQIILEKQLTSDFYYLQTAEEWFTVLEKDGEHDFDRMTKLGRKLSKTAEGPVLLVHYFDDDIFELHLLSKGKTLGSYQAEISRNFCRKSAAFVEALDLSTKEAQAFRYLTKKEMSPSESIHWLSRLFGARLYADKGLLDNKEEFWRKDTAAVLAGIDAEKKASKVNNQTDLILLDEVLGMDIQDSHSRKDIFEDHQDRVLRVSLLNSDGNYDFSRITCFQELDGRFVKVHEYQYAEEAFTKKDMRIWMDYEHYEFFDIDVEGFCLGAYIDWDQWEPIFAQDRKIPLEQKQNCAHLPEWLSYPMTYISAGGYDYRHLHGLLEKIDEKHSGHRFDERKILAEYHYEEDNDYWWQDSSTPLCVVDDMIVVMRIRWKRPVSVEKAVDVRFFDRDLKLIRKEQVAVDEKLPNFLHYCYDKELDTLFLSTMAINLKTHKITPCSAQIKAKYVLTCLDDRKNVYMLSGHSLYVLSSDMKLLSHHMIKGTLMDYYKNARGNLCLITGSDIAEKASQLRAGSGIRIYEVAEKK